MSWIKELVSAEQKMEESGMIDYALDFDPEKQLFTETIQFLEDLKIAFVEVSTAFNQLKGTNLNRIKIYGIANTHADFMLFRNGFKLIFAMKEPGVIGIRFQFAGVQFSQSDETDGKSGSDETLLTAKWGPFGVLSWNYKDQPIKIDYLVKYYLSKFIKESAK